MPTRPRSLARIPRQLTLDGSEVAHPPRRSQRPLALSTRQVLDMLEHEGELSSVEAGVALHRLQGCVQEGSRWLGWTGNRSRGCCPYASAAGYRALKRLEELGLAQREAGGSWRPVSVGAESVGAG